MIPNPFPISARPLRAEGDGACVSAAVATPAPRVWPYPGRTIAELWRDDHEARRAADRRALDCAFGGR